MSLGKTLGKGTFGKVKLGTHVLTKEKVIKPLYNKEVSKFYYRPPLKFWISR